VAAPFPRNPAGLGRDSKHRLLLPFLPLMIYIYVYIYIYIYIYNIYILSIYGHLSESVAPPFPRNAAGLRRDAKHRLLLGVWGLGFGVEGLGLGVRGHGLWFMVYSLWYRVGV